MIVVVITTTPNAATAATTAVNVLGVELNAVDNKFSENALFGIEVEFC